MPTHAKNGIASSVEKTETTPAALNKGTRRRLREKNRHLTELIQLQKMTGQLESEAARVPRKIRELRAAMPPELLRAFDRAMDHGRAPVARITETGACGSCHLRLPSGVAPSFLIESEQIHKCPNCGCFLYSSQELAALSSARTHGKSPIAAGVVQVLSN